MLNTQPLLNGKGLLLAMITAILSGQALADTAGRVSFVTGEVAAISNDGGKRLLNKGDLVNSGERLETGKGRVQIRFTDGSFVSLQPNTVFGLDNYSYSKDKPEEGSLLFNFLRGGMRTVSGAIGKVNRANYKVKTPVATIGIRGTGYAGRLSNNKLIVSVSKGIVNLSNNFGSSNVPAGQTFQTQEGKAPEPAPEGVTAGARADGPDNGREQNERDDHQGPQGSGSPDTTVIAVVDDISSGKLEEIVERPTPEPQPIPGPLFTDSVINLANDDITPQYSAAFGLFRSSTNARLGVHYNAALGAERNAVTLIEEIIAGDALIKNTVFDAGTLKTVNIHTKNGITFGEWTNGVGTFDGNSLNLGVNEFMPYIVGLQATSNDENSKVTFRLDQASAARNGAASGALQHFNLTVNYAQGLVDVDFRVLINGNTYTVNEQGIYNINIDTAAGSFLSNLLAQGVGCAQAGCPTVIDFFFAGVKDSNNSIFSSQVGSSYKIDLANSSSITGVASLSLDPQATTTFTPGPQQLTSSASPDFAATFVSNNDGLPLVSEAAVSARFDASNGALLQAVNDAGNAYQLVSSDAQVKNSGSYEKVLTWGQWSGGVVSVPGHSLDVALGGVDLHYIVGVPTSTTDLLNTRGSVSYALIGGSVPQAELNGVQGYLNQSGSLTVSFSGRQGLGNATLNMTLGGFSADNVANPAGLTSLTFNGQTSLVGTSALNFSDMAVSANNGALVCSACIATASGGFAGGLTTVGASSVPMAAGLGYHVEGTVTPVGAVTAGSDTAVFVGGTAAFAKPAASGG